MKFRTKPVEKEAWKVEHLLHCSENNWDALPVAVKASYEAGEILFLAGAISVFTLEGWMKGNVDDWLIQGLKGELYPCKPDIFEKTYESVDESITTDEAARMKGER